MSLDLNEIIEKPQETLKGPFTRFIQLSVPDLPCINNILLLPHLFEDFHSWNFFQPG